MNPKPFNNLIKKGILPLVACSLLTGFVVWWYLFLNRYLCLFHREQSQMFLFSWEYFQQYLEQPGGMTAYAASFLTQLFYYPMVGAVIYLLIFGGCYKIFKLTLDMFSLFKSSFTAAFIPGLLYLPASINLQFDIADELAVMVALSGFILLTRIIRGKFKYLFIPLTVSGCYILVGGNVVLSLLLFVFYLFFKQQKGYWAQMPTVILSLFIPFAIWYFFYLTSFNDACLALTPFRYPDARWADFRVIAWLSVIIIPVAGMLLKNVKADRKWMISYNVALCIILLLVVLKQYGPSTGNIVRMGYDAENDNWESIINTSKETPIGPLNCLYTNLALQKTGQLAEKMFCYDQIGLPGLILDMQDNFSCQAKSEVFHQLGLINEAQHYAYESMIGYASVKEPNVRNLKRLLECAVIRKDSALSEKYGKILDKTLFYKNYIREQGIKYPPSIAMKDILIRDTPVVLASALEDNPKNQAVFEYLMACYLLEREYEKAKNCYDRYFPNFSYPRIPVHYAEFLMLYKRLNKLDDSFYDRYPISRDVRERFEMMDILVSSKMDKQIQKALEDGYKDTYWFYVRFPLVGIQTTKKDEKNIY
jgi:hypothetical protein